MELFLFVLGLMLIVMVIGAGNTGNAYVAMTDPSPVGQASGCGAFVLGLLIVALIALWITAAVGGSVCVGC